MITNLSLRRSMGIRPVGRGVSGLSAAAPNVAGMIATAAQQQGVPAGLAMAVAQHESGFDQSRIGQAGEVGVFQLLPSSFPGVAISDLQTNVNTGVSYLAQMYSLTGNWGDALIAYNEGPTNWANGVRASSSQNYSSSILAASGIQSGDFGAPDISNQPTVVASGQNAPAAPGAGAPPQSQTMPVSPIDTSATPPSGISTGELLAGTLAGLALMFLLTD